jgi:signal transduction histidine kinase
MAATVSTATSAGNALGEDLAVPPGVDRGSTARAIPGARAERYARREVASNPASDSARPLRPAPLLIDAALAVVAFAGSLAFIAASDDGEGLDAVNVLLSALASLPLVARRVSPVAVFVLTALASAVLYGVTDVDGPPLGPTLALYTMAAAGDESRTRNLSTLGLAGVLLVLHAMANGLRNDAFPGTELVFGVLVWGGAWLAGDRTRLRRERIAQLEERALRAEREAERERRLAAAEERSRIARDLHDSAGHAINVILVHAGAARLRKDDDPQALREAFATIEQVARETVGEIDQMVGALREDGERPEGEVEPPAGLSALDALVERHRSAGMEVTTAVRGDRRPLPPAVDRGAYRILQEALTNAARHGDGDAEVEVAFGRDALELNVANTIGRAGDSAGGGHGLIGMRERATLLGGSLDAGARNGRFHVHARLPVAEHRP